MPAGCAKHLGMELHASKKLKLCRGCIDRNTRNTGCLAHTRRLKDARQHTSMCDAQTMGAIRHFQMQSLTHTGNLPTMRWTQGTRNQLSDPNCLRMLFAVCCSNATEGLGSSTFLGLQPTAWGCTYDMHKGWNCNDPGHPAHSRLGSIVELCLNKQLHGEEDLLCLFKSL